MIAQPADGDAKGPMAVYKAALRDGRFSIQRCESCARHVFFPRELCPHCASDALVWVEPSGRGCVYATTVVRRRHEQGGPYNVALVDLDEGVRLMSRVDGLAPEEVRIGLRVRIAIAQVKGETVPVFRPDSPA